MICNRTNRIHNCARIASDARTAIQPDGLTDLTTFSGKPCMKTVFFSGAIFSFFLSVCIAADAIKTQSVTTTWSPDPFENLPPKPVVRRFITTVNIPSITPSVILDSFDVEQDPISVSSFNQAQQGTVEDLLNGTFLYTPHLDYVGDDSFEYTLDDGRGGRASATMHITVVPHTDNASSTTFTDLAVFTVNDKPITYGSGASVPRVVDFDSDGDLDLLVGAAGAVWLHRNTGSKTSPLFTQGVRLQSDGKDISFGTNRVSIAWVDVDANGTGDLVTISDPDRVVQYYPNTANGLHDCVLASPIVCEDAHGSVFRAADIRADCGDLTGDGVPDLLTGSFSGSVKLAKGVRKASGLTFEEPTSQIDKDGFSIDGSYNINVRLFDLDHNGLLDLCDSYNWGTIRVRRNYGSNQSPRFGQSGELGISGHDYEAVDLHSLCDGGIIDFGDLDGDGTLDLILGGEKGGSVRFARGISIRSHLTQFRNVLSEHTHDLAHFLMLPENKKTHNLLLTSVAALYDNIETLASPQDKIRTSDAFLEIINQYPQYFAIQSFDVHTQPGMASLAVQTWLTTLIARQFDPDARSRLCDAAGFTDGYRGLVEQTGLIYADNNRNPRGAEAIRQWVRTIPREIYPGTCITANDWLGGRTYLVRGHLKNTFNGSPESGGEYGFSEDARPIIGTRGSENLFMTVVHHEASHDVDAFVRRSPALLQRWGRVLVAAGGPDMRADPVTGWIDMNRTRQHFHDVGHFDGNPAHWNDAWKQYWLQSTGADWKSYGFMRGNIPWFYDAVQESLATQGNQHWNTTEGRLEVAIDRWMNGYKSNLTEVLFFLDIWSVGLSKTLFYETDDACNQVIRFAKLGRTNSGAIHRIDLGDRFYHFSVDDMGTVIDVLHVPTRNPR